MRFKNSTSDNKRYTLGQHFGLPAVNALEFETDVRDRLKGRKLENLTAGQLLLLVLKLEERAQGHRNSVAPLQADAAKLRSLAEQMDQATLREEGQKC